MKPRQLILRIDAMIGKDKRSMWGYMGAAKKFNSNKYNARISRLNGSIERKKEAVIFLSDCSFPCDYSVEDIREKFKFNMYRNK